MVQILPEVPSFGASLGRSLGGGIATGLSKAAQFAQQMAVRKQKSLANAPKEVQAALIQSVPGFKEMSPKEQQSLYNSALAKRLQGHDQFTSARNAFEEYSDTGEENSPSFMNMLMKASPGGIAQTLSEATKKNLKGLGATKEKVPKDQQEWKMPSREKFLDFGLLGPASGLMHGRDIASGATAGLTDYLLPEEAKDLRSSDVAPDFQKGAGQLFGSILPISAISKGVTAISGLYNITKGAAAVLGSGAGLAGYESIKDGFDKGTFSPTKFALNFMGGSVAHMAVEALPSFMKSMGNYFKKLKLSPMSKTVSGVAEKTLIPTKADATKYVMDLAEKEGVNLKGVYEGDTNEVAKFESLVNRVSQEKPSILNEKVSRNFAEANVEQTARDAQILEDRLAYSKRVARISEEVAEEQGRVLEAAAKKDHLASVIRKNAMMQKAKSELPVAVKILRQAEKDLSFAKDNLSYLKKIGGSEEKIAELGNSIERMEMLIKETRDTVKGLKYQANTGAKWKTPREIELESLNDIENFEVKFKNRSSEDLLKSNALDEAADKIQGYRELPGTERLPSDTHTRIKKARIEGYQRKLAELEAEQMHASPERYHEIEAMKPELKKLISQNQKHLKLHQRRKGLQEVGETLRQQEAIRTATTKPSGKEQEIFKKALSKPTPTNIKEAIGEVADKETTAIADKIVEEVKALPEPERGETMGEMIAKERNQVPPSSKTENPKDSWMKRMMGGLKDWSSVTKIIKNLTGLSVPYWISSAVIKELTGISTGPTALTQAASDVYSSQYVKSLSSKEKELYYIKLRKKGVSPKRIKRIRTWEKAA